MPINIIKKTHIYIHTYIHKYKNTKKKKYIYIKKLVNMCVKNLNESYCI
jgi:hypothetical protein